jgi:hypothetical protein
MSTLSKIFQIKNLWLPIALGLGQFAPGIITAAYNHFFGTNMAGADEMGATIWVATWRWCSTYPWQHYDRALWVSAALLAITASYRHGWPFFQRQWLRRLLLQNIGIRAYMRRESDESRKESWGDCVSHLLDTENDTIRMLVANGWETFGDRDCGLCL